MRYLVNYMIVVIVTVSLSMLAGCSSSGISVEADLDQKDVVNTFGEEFDGMHNMIGAYMMRIDPESLSVTLEPMERSSDYHFPLTNYYPNVLAITGYGLDPAHNNDFYADIRLSHPFPGSGINGFDARVIAILPANDGVSFFYPTFNVRGNNTALMNYDAFTGLWDDGGIAGNVNPFISYFKGEANRIWDSNGTVQDTRRFYVDFDGFGGAIQYILKVDVSTAYPDQSLPVRDNAQEPVEMSTMVISNMLPTGGDALVEVTLLDWQGSENIKIKVECPDLYDLSVQLFYNRPGPNADEYIFSGTISNNHLAPSGDHDMLVVAWDIVTGVKSYSEAIARVNYEPSAWNVDPVRWNIDLTTISDMFPPRPGSDLGVVDNADPVIGGVVMYEPDDMVVKMDLNLTTCELHGYSYMPSDNDPENPHPNPDYFPTVRIDAQETGHVVQSWNDSHLGLGPDLAGQFQRDDALIGIMEPDGFGWIDFLIGAFPNMANDNPLTEDYDESKERPRLTDVYEEYDNGNNKFVLSGIWSGTVVWDITTGNTFNPIGVMGGIKRPYWAPPFIVMDWGLWIFTGPPTNEIKAADSSQDLYWPFQYWGYSGTMTGPALIAQYDKWGATMAAFRPSNLEANLLDIELIPRQDPPLEINGILQEIDWVAILLDNNTIEILDPYVTPQGQIVDVIDLSVLEGDAVYLDVQNSNANIFISHTDGVTPYCSVFVLE
ncbi:MAG: hypothetical protein ABIG42_03560 [bacterium]